MTNEQELQRNLERSEELKELQKRNLRQLLDDAISKQGHYVAVKSAMGYSNQPDSKNAMPTYTVAHSIKHISNKSNIKMGSEMSYMQDYKTDENGTLQIDAETTHMMSQRAPNWTRQKSLTSYLLQNKNHKFGTILAVISPSWIYDDDSENWGPDGRALKSAIDYEALDSAGKLGLIKIDDTIEVYALDGQHRIMGIRGLEELLDGSLVLKKENGTHTQKIISREDFLIEHSAKIEDLQNIMQETIPVEYLPAIIKGETKEESKARLRSIFVSINKYAKPPTKGEIGALEENDGFFIVARAISKSHELFNNGKLVDFKNTNIPERSTNISTLQTIRDMIAGYMAEAYVSFDEDQPNPTKNWTPKQKNTVPARPPEDEIKEVVKVFSEVLDNMSSLSVFHKILRGSDIIPLRAFKYKDKETKEMVTGNGNILLRPIGQTIFSKAVGKLKSKGLDFEEIFKRFKKLDSRNGFEQINPSNIWWRVTYDPIGGKGRMITNHQDLAVKLLVYLVTGLEDERERIDLLAEVKKLRSNDKNDKWTNFSGDEVSYDDGEEGSDLPKVIL